jgi:tetratricopeptide (TPR) repeat protein
MLDAWETLGVTLARLGRLEDAILALGEALALDPERAETHLVLARYHARLGHLDVAREHGRLAARNSPGRGYEVLAQVEMDARRPEQAAEAAAKSVAADESRIMSHFILGVVAQQQGRCEDALAAFDRAEQAKRVFRHGVLRDLYANQGACLVRLGRRAEAEQAFVEELEQIPSSASARVGLAGLYHAQGREADARTVLAGLIDATPRPGPGTYWTVVQGLLALGEAEEAGRVAQRAAALFPSDPRFRPGG